MALELANGESVTQTLAIDETISIEVETQTANYIEALVDDSAGGAPSEYDIEVEFYSTSADAYFTVDDSDAITEANPLSRRAAAQKIRVTLTAGAGTDYRLSVESFTEI